jgi:phthalate 4,5-cis-dihydrodiol dehydrogenase
LERRKELGRYGAAASTEGWSNWGYSATTDFPNQPFFGLTLLNCEKGAIRQSAHGLLVYDEHGRREVPLDKELRGRAAELTELYNTVVHGKPAFHDGRWGMATLEICLAILTSARERREIVL